MKKSFRGEMNTVSAAVLLAGVILLVSLASLGYTAVLRSKDRSDDLRGSLSYVRSQVKDRDSAGCVEIRDGGSRLVLKDEADGQIFELRIYEADGKLWEEYLPEGADPGPESARAVAETSEFFACFEGEGLLMVRTGEGTALIRLFGAGEAEK